MKKDCLVPCTCETHSLTDMEYKRLCVSVLRFGKNPFYEKSQEVQKKREILPFFNCRIRFNDACH